MSDCTNVEIRELLPEYLHDRLGATARARVDAHVATCADCAGELAVLRSVRQAYAGRPAIDTDAIVRALPRPATTRRRRRTATPWLRVAAVVSFVSLGGISIVALRDFLNGDGARHMVDTLALGTDSSRPAMANGAYPVISFGGGVSDLGTDDLEALLAAVETLEGALPAEPDDLLDSDARRGGS